MEGFVVRRREMPRPSKDSLHVLSERDSQSPFDFPNSHVCIFEDAVSRGWNGKGKIHIYYPYNLIFSHTKILMIEIYNRLRHDFQEIKTYDRIIANLSDYDRASTSSCSYDQVGFSSNGFESAFLQVKSLQETVSIEIDKLRNKRLEILRSQSLVQGKNLTSRYRLPEDI